MRILIIPDKFKGSLTGTEVIAAMREGIRRFDDQIEVHTITASDGGDGFLDAIRKSRESVQTIRCEVTDPLRRPITADYGLEPTEGKAFIEMARASGMELLEPAERNPLLTTTYGTGQLVTDAVSRGATEIYLGLGGSATNDGGTGIAEAAGYRFLGNDRTQLSSSGETLESIASIDASEFGESIKAVKFFAINDVSNPLLGPEGAAAVYAPQKGADAAMVKRLEAGLDHLQEIVKRDLGVDVADTPGAGAAGGTGYGLKAFFDAEFLSGIEFVLSLTGIQQLLASGTIDLIVTGEGKIDDQTAYGKLVRGVADIGEKYRVPVVALCGILSLQQKSVADLGLADVKQIHDPERPVEYTMTHAEELLIAATRDLIASRNADS